MKVLIQQKTDSEMKEYHVSVGLAEALTALLDNVVKHDEEEEPQKAEHRRVDALFPDWSRKAGKAVRQETAAEMAIQEDEKRRRGFVITHCDVCGDRYAWNAKLPVYSFTCKNCNQRIAFNSHGLLSSAALNATGPGGTTRITKATKSRPVVCTAARRWFLTGTRKKRLRHSARKPARRT